MSSTNPRYDPCVSQMHDNMNRSTLEYVMNPLMYKNCSKCTPELGIPSGPAHVQVKGESQKIDLENDLKGITQNRSKCPSAATPRKYEFEYLQPCQLAGHPPVPAPRPITLSECPYEFS